MNSDNNALSRRLLLQRCAYAAGAVILAGSATEASAETGNMSIPKKSSRAQAGYQHVMDSRKCGNCRHLEGGGSCQVVEGKVELDGHCRLHAKKLTNI